MSLGGRVRAWAPAGLWAATIFVLSAIPGDRYPDVPIWNADKMVHVGVYGVLGVLVARALTLTTSLSAARVFAWAASTGALYGVSDEIHQMFVPKRSPDWRDVVADSAGALLGAWAWAKLRQARGRRP